MFTEFWCGCITSIEQGRVRICPSHRPQRADGSGAVAHSMLRGVKRYYPANGEMLSDWGGGK